MPEDRQQSLSVSEVISALSFALDLTEGQPPGHAVRCCVFGMQVAQELGLPVDAQADLYYASLMKDAGCSTNASKMFRMLGMDEIKAKRDVKTTDWTKTGWEALQYALGHVKPGAPFLERMRALVEMARNQKQNAARPSPGALGCAMRPLMPSSASTNSGAASVNHRDYRARRSPCSRAS